MGRSRYFLSTLLFLFLMAVGLRASYQMPLWNDEYYSLVSSTLSYSYLDMITGKISEGNNSPLFYLWQRIQCDLFHYEAPFDWMSGNWGREDPYSQVFLRLQSVICMALALTSLFHYFSRRYNLMSGFYALAVAFSSFMIWGHWLEARPYSLWFCLSIWQMLILIDLFGRKNDQDWTKLLVVQWLLAFTATISAVQILAAGISLWVFANRRSWKDVLNLMVPIGVCVFYYVVAPKYKFCFVDGPVDLISANIPKDRFVFIGLFALIFAYMGLKKRDWALHLEGKYLGFVGIVFLIFAAVIIQLQLGAKTGGFQVSNRYFMPLTALGVVSATLFSIYLVRISQWKWPRLAMVLALVLFLGFRLYKTFQIVPFYKFLVQS